MSTFSYNVRVSVQDVSTEYGPFYYAVVTDSWAVEAEGYARASERAVAFALRSLADKYLWVAPDINKQQENT